MERSTLAIFSPFLRAQWGDWCENSGHYCPNAQFRLQNLGDVDVPVSAEDHFSSSRLPERPDETHVGLSPPAEAAGDLRTQEELF